MAIGFLSPYTGTDTVDMGGGYWVKVKRFLTVTESEAAEVAYFASTRLGTGPDGRPVAQVDPVPRMFEQVLASIVEWNLTDENGDPLPSDHNPDLERTSGRPSPRRRSLQMLPQVAFDKISAVVGGHNNNDPEGDARFRDGSPVVHGVGEVESSDDREVHPGAEVVDDVGDPDRSDPADAPTGAGGGGVSGVDADDGGGSSEGASAETVGETAAPVEVLPA